MWIKNGRKCTMPLIMIINSLQMKAVTVKMRIDAIDWNLADIGNSYQYTLHIAQNQWRKWYFLFKATRKEAGKRRKINTKIKLVWKSCMVAETEPKAIVTVNILMLSPSNWPSKILPAEYLGWYKLFFLNQRTYNPFWHF